MHSHRLSASLLLAAAGAALFLPAARAEDAAPATAKFSDPAKPGTVKIVLARGNLHIQGADTPDVTVKSDLRAQDRKPRKDGLRVLTASTSYTLVEKDNVITLDAASDGWIGGGSDFRLTVPRSASIVVQNSFGGDIACAGVGGDLEIHSMNGEVRLDDVAGGVVVDTMNGEIRANVRELHDNKPLSFQSMNGEVVLRVPAAAKANVRLRTQNGSVLTDFEDTALVTKTENTPRAAGVRHGRAVIPAEAQQAIREAARAGAQAMHEAAQAVREGINADDDSERAANQAALAKAEAARAKAEAARQAAEAKRAAAMGDIGAAPPAPPAPAAAPWGPTPPKMPAIPTISGGKLVTGTLNGGGPEISVATMNGDITLRQLEKK